MKAVCCHYMLWGVDDQHQLSLRRVDLCMAKGVKVPWGHDLTCLHVTLAEPTHCTQGQYSAPQKEHCHTSCCKRLAVLLIKAVARLLSHSWTRFFEHACSVSLKTGMNSPLWLQKSRHLNTNWEFFSFFLNLMQCSLNLYGNEYSVMLRCLTVFIFFSACIHMWMYVWVMLCMARCCV